MLAYHWTHYLTHPHEWIKETVRTFIYGIRNLSYWFPVIWQDRHYASGFLYYVLRHKLVAMERDIRRKPDYPGELKEADKMHICILLINRIIAFQYHENSFLHHVSKWGKLRGWLEPTFNDQTGDIDPELCRHVSHWPNANTQKEKKLAWKEFETCRRHSVMMARQDKQLLFRHLRKLL